MPWLLTGWSSAGAPGWVQAVGWVALAAGAAVLLDAFARFVFEGVGTPAPVAPMEKLVVGGLYRYVRNPMYLAVAGVILGQAAVLGRWLLVVYAVAFGATVWSFVHWYEEPTLRRQFGTEYEDYLRPVPGWWPRPSTAADGLMICSGKCRRCFDGSLLLARPHRDHTRVRERQARNEREFDGSRGQVRYSEFGQRGAAMGTKR